MSGPDQEPRQSTRQIGRVLAISRLIRIVGPHRAAELVKEADAHHRELGEHLRESVAEVQSWPPEDQRSQAIRNQPPPRHRETP